MKIDAIVERLQFTSFKAGFQTKRCTWSSSKCVCAGPWVLSPQSTIPAIASEITVFGSILDICGGYNASTCGVFIPSQVNCPLSIIKNQSLHSFFQQHFSTHELLASFASCFWIHPTDLLRWSSMKCSKAGTTWDVWPSLSSVCWLWPRAIVGVDTNYDFQQTCQMKSAYLLNINWQMDLYMFVAWKEPSTISTICKNLTWLLHKLGNMAGQAFTGATNQPQGYQITLDSRQEQMEENSSLYSKHGISSGWQFWETPKEREWQGMVRKWFKYSCR